MNCLIEKGLSAAWCVSGALCVYVRSPRAVLRVIGQPSMLNGQLCAICRAYSPTKQRTHGPQGLYAVSALRPHGQEEVSRHDTVR